MPKVKMATWVAWLDEREPSSPLEWWYSVGESSASGEPDMNRPSALVLGSLFCSLALMIQTSLAQNDSRSYLHSPYCNSTNSLRCLRLENQK